MGLQMRKAPALHIVLTLLASIARLSAIDLCVRATPELAIPVYSLVQDDPTVKTYALGGGIRLNADLELFDILALGAEASISSLPFTKVSLGTSMLRGGLSIGAFFIPISRLKLYLGAAGGVYQMNHETFGAKGYYRDLYARGQFMAGFRFNPTWSFSAGAGYGIDFHQWTPLYHGLSVQLSVNMNLDLAKARDEVTVEYSQEEPLFPILFAEYSKTPLGSLTVTNGEKSEIRDLRVEFFSERYTSGSLLCGSSPVLNKGASLELPLLAGFNETLLQFTEEGEIPGQVAVSYSMIGAQRRTVKSLALKVRNRNSLRWTEAAAPAAMVSPNAPEILDYAKYIVGIARNRLRTGLDRNMQFALYLYEGLRLSGLTCAPDISTPYGPTHLDPALVDYLQYPAQTLAYRSGDVDDIGLLYAACLESVGVRAAYIPLADDFLVCFRLSAGQGEAERLFAGPDSYLAIGDEAWIPVSSAKLREGFVNAWYAGLQAIKEATSTDSAAWPEMVILEEAWAARPPLGVESEASAFQKPSEAQLARAAENGMIRYISAELGPKIREVQAAIKLQGGSPALYNQLGLLYVRAGMYAEAKAEFSRSAGQGSVPAMVNLGNVALLERDYAAASESFRKALSIAPDNKAAQTGLSRATAELE
jgi:hypothetical protein